MKLQNSDFSSYISILYYQSNISDYFVFDVGEKEQTLLMLKIL